MYVLMNDVGLGYTKGKGSRYVVCSPYWSCGSTTCAVSIIMSIWMPRRGGSLRPMAMSLASLSRPGYRFKIPAQQQLFLLESLSLSLSARRLGSTSTGTHNEPKPDLESISSGKPGSASSKGSTLFAPAPTKPASSSASTSSPPAKSTDNNAEVSTPLDAKPVVAEDKSAVKSKDEAKPEGRLARSWAWIKHEANHYWDGSKLLAAEVRVSSKLLRKVLNGARLTRRERRQASLLGHPFDKQMHLRL